MFLKVFTNGLLPLTLDGAQNMNSQRVSEFMSHDVCEQEIPKTNFYSVVAYPQNNVRELAKIMRDINIERLPVLFSPWDKKLVGFIEFNKIRVFLKD